MPSLQPRVFSRDFLLHWFSYLAMSMAFYFLLPTLPVFVTKGLGEDTSKVGLIIGVYSLSALLIRPAAGYALDVFGRKAVFIIALVLYTAAMGGYLIASTFTLLLILRFVHGLTWGVITTGGSTIAADLVPEEKRGEGIGYFGLSITLSIALGPLIGLSIMEPDNFDALFMAAFAVSLLAMLIALLVKVPKLSSREKHKLSWNDFFEKKVIPLSLVMMVAAISYGGIISFVALFYQDRAIEYGSLFFLFYSIGVAVFRPIAGKIMDKRGPALLIFPSFIANIIGLLMLAFSSEPKLFLFSALIIGLGNGVIMPTIQTMIINLVPINRRGVANSTFFSAIDLGIGAGSVLLGYLASLFGIANMFIICAILILIPMAFFFLVALKHYNTHNLNNKVDLILDEQENE